MSFYGKSFIFDGVSSEIYDLRLFEFDQANPEDSPAGGSVEIQEEWLYRRDTPYFYGRYYAESLEFDFVVGSFNYIDGITRNAIEEWLLGRSNYLPLKIVQDDISDITYNVIITRSTHKYIGNLNYALSLHAKCDRPWGVFYPPRLTKTYSGSANETFDYINNSMYDGYNRPIITFTMGSLGGNFSLINNTDISGSIVGREFKFTNLSSNEKVTVDNDRGTITSTSGSLLLDKFNKNFFRTIKGVNSLTISGSIVEFTLDTTFAKGVGA